MKHYVDPEDVMSWPRLGDHDNEDDVDVTFGGYLENVTCCQAVAVDIEAICTRVAGHPSPHIAHANFPNFAQVQVVKVWPKEDGNVEVKP